MGFEDMGTFGQIFQVRHITDGRPYALEVHPKKGACSWTVQNKINEKEFFRALDDFLIITLFYAVQKVKNVDMVLEQAPCDLLGSGDEVYQFLVAQIVLEFKYLHASSRIQRDMKLDDVPLMPDNYIKICDLGLGMECDDRIFEGTPPRIAPEILLSGGYGKSVDSWSLSFLFCKLKCKRNLLDSGGASPTEIERTNEERIVPRGLRKRFRGLSCSCARPPSGGRELSTRHFPISLAWE